MTRPLAILVWFCLLVAPAAGANVLVVIAGSSPSFEESERLSDFQSWGHTVSTIQDSDSQGNFDTAVEGVDVVYVCGTIQPWELLYKLRKASCGLVSEVPDLDTEFGFATGDGYTITAQHLYNADESHPVSNNIGTGTIDISSDITMSINGNSPAPGFLRLGDGPSNQMGLGVIESGDELANTYDGNLEARNRRVRAPWADINWSRLDADGERIARQSIAWAALGTPHDESGLLLHWKLDETSGATAADASGAGRDGSVSGTAAWTDGRRVGGVDVDGSSKLQVTDLLGEPTSFTVAAWVDTDSVGANGGVAVSVGDHIALVMDEPNFTSGQPAIVFNYSSSYFEYLGAGGSAVGAGWRHYVAVFDSANDTLSLYIDGQLAATKATTREIDWASSFGSTTTAGGNSYPIGGYEFDGRIDDVRVYNRALSEEEIADIHGLIAHWKLDESSGTTAADSSLSANNGSYAGGATLGAEGPYPGPGDSAAQFDGTNDHVSAGEIDTSFADGLTFAVWGKPTAVKTWARLFDIGNGENADNVLFARNAGTNDLTLAVHGGSLGGAQYLYAPGTLVSDQWTHYAVTIDNTGQATIYADGVAVASGSVGQPAEASRSTVYVARSAWSADEYFEGSMFDARIYNRALSAEEIAGLAEDEFLIAHWTFDEGSGTTIADSSGNGNDASFDSGAPTWGDAIRGGGIEFDGSSDADTDAPFTPPARGSVAFWFRHNGVPASTQRIFGSADNFEARHTNLGKISLDFGAGITFQTSGYYTDPDRWTHCVCNYDTDSGDYEVYIDGRLLASGTKTMSAPSAGTLTFGTRTGYSPNFSGGLDDLRVYNHPLTAAEVAELHGLVGHWKLDETSGLTAADSTAIGRDLSGNNSPGWTNGARLNAASLTTAARFESAAGEFSDIEGEVAVACWFRLDSDVADLENNLNFVDCDTGGAQTGFTLQINQGGQEARFWKRDGTTAEKVTGDVSHVKAGQWRQVAGMYDGSEMRLYLDGQLVDTRADTTGLAPDEDQLRIGTSLSGAIDDVVLYNRAMQPHEVAEHFGLVGRWGLDESSGSVAADDSGVRNDLSANGSGSVTWGESGVRGDAAHTVDTLQLQSPNGVFDGVDEAVSVACWMKTDLDLADVPTSNAWLFRCDGTGNGFGLKAVPTTPGIRFQKGDGSGTTTCNSDASHADKFTAGVWRHVVGVYDGSELRLYLDNEVIETVADTAGIDTRTDPLTLGTNLAVTLDDVRVYNRAMLDWEIAEHYGLVGRWRLDESSGTVAADSSGMARHGTYLGTPTLGGVGPAGLGLAAYFDGVDDAVMLPAIDESFQDGVTLAGWMKPTAIDNYGKIIQLSIGTGNAIDLGRGGVSNGIRGYIDSAGDIVANEGIHNNAWRHYALTVDSDGVARLYRNGVALVEGTRSVPNNLIRTTNWIGASNWGHDEAFEGQLSDVRVYNRAITPEEARSLYFGDFVPGLRIVEWVETANP